ncbi:hypothetical protein [Deinococcus daejeonensis]|nr:hypothetical protein [Deinococcus daejeonensis]
MEGELGLVYVDDLDEQGWPDDPLSDPRVLACSEPVKLEAFAQIWTPLREQLNIPFELLDIQDLPAEAVPAALTWIETPSASDSVALRQYRPALAAFLRAAHTRGQGVTVSL